MADFPEPPRQHDAWKVSTNAGPEIVSAARTLFEEGLSDPRGCEYREIEIRVGNVWSCEGRLLRTHGWILPGVATNQPFAVCWNGLAYPVLQIGPRADLPSDVETMIRGRMTNAEMHLVLYDAFPEKISAAADFAQPIKACLLMRLGEEELALRLWGACGSVLDNFKDSTPRKDPYLLLAGDWAWALFDRALGAHMRGDVSVALVSARKLKQIQPLIEAEAARRGFARLNTADAKSHDQPQPYIYFLESLPRLLTDLERRAREPMDHRSATNLTNIPNQSKRIAALISEMDQVAVPQISQPGRVEPEMDPIVTALIKEGDAAVEPLIHCLEDDARLTRSVGFFRDFRRSRVIITVRGAARAALEDILQTQFSGDPKEVRAFWDRYKDHSNEDRWYEVLRKESIAEKKSFVFQAAGGSKRTEERLVLGRGPWMDAARSIVQTDVPGASPQPHASSAGTRVKLRGEVLRAKKNPSVTELLVKEADVVVEEAKRQDQAFGVDAIRAGWELIRIIHAWDPPAATAPARALMRRAVQLFSDQNSFIMSSGPELARCLPTFAQIRIETGDAGAWAEYIDWIRSVKVENVDEYAIEAFEPIWRNPKNPSAAAAGEWLFNDPASPWSTLPWKRSAFHDPLESELVRVPAFRRLIARELKNQTAQGSMQWRSGSIHYVVPGRSGSGVFQWPENEQPAEGAKVEIRRCDWVAWQLSRSKQIPFFNPFAPVAQRDAAIERAAADLVKAE